LYLLGLQRPRTETTHAEQKCLLKYVKNKKRIVEIGVFHGVNTKTFRQEMADDGIILAVDPFGRSLFGIRGYGWARMIAHREISKMRNGKVIWVEETGEDAVKLNIVKGLLPVDFIFIDGDHSWDGIKGDWESWHPEVELNGIVALHDSKNTDGSDSEKYTNQIILKNYNFKEIDRVDRLTILKKIS